MGNRSSAQINKEDYIIIEEQEIGVDKTARESTSEYSSESDIENDVFDYRKELKRELEDSTFIKHKLNFGGYYNTVGSKDQRIAFLEEKLNDTEIEYNTLYNEYMRLRIKMKKND